MMSPMQFWNAPFSVGTAPAAPFSQAMFPYTAQVGSDPSSHWRRNVQAIYAETVDFVRRSVERQAMATENCLRADSLEAAFNIQLSLARASMDDYYDHVARVMRLSASMASNDHA